MIAPQTLEEAKKMRYGQWSGNEQGHHHYSEQCAWPVTQASQITCQCNRAPGHGPEGLYCKQHARMLPKPPMVIDYGAPKIWETNNKENCAMTLVSVGDELEVSVNGKTVKISRIDFLQCKCADELIALLVEAGLDPKDWQRVYVNERVQALAYALCAPAIPHEPKTHNEF